MPRKRRNKKDPLAQKINFDKEPDGPSETVNGCGSNGISQSEKHREILGGICGPEAEAPPTASSEQPRCAEFVPVDFAHRDRLRFGRSYGMTEDEADDEDRSPRKFLFICICLIFLIVIVQWIKTEGYNFLLTWYWDLLGSMETNMTNEDNKKDKLLSYLGLSSLGFLWSLLLSFLLGVSCLFFSWAITYQDSLQPGQFPPSPVSPKKYRKQSGHTFHSSYVMGVMNGIAVFALSAWWLCT